METRASKLSDQSLRDFADAHSAYTSPATFNTQLIYDYENLRGSLKDSLRVPAPGLP